LKKILFFIIAIIIISCQEKEKRKFILPDNATELIAGDSIKTWKLAKRFNNGHRMNMGDCFLSYRVSYQRNQKMRDNNSEYLDCGKSLHAEWKLITNDNGNFIKLESEELPELLNIDENYKYFKIVSLSEDELILKFKHAQFSNKKMIITDYLVPENKNVKGRDFHNR
jgi:hypothetical protein